MIILRKYVGNLKTRGMTMGLTYEEIKKIMLEELNGEEPTIKGDEADKFRENLKKDIELAKKNKWVIEIPPE